MRTRHFWLKGFAAIVLAACGGGGGSPDAGDDGGGDATTNDVNVKDVSVVDASDASDGGVGDSATPVDGGGSLTGEQAFPVHFTWLDPSLPIDGCGGTAHTIDGGLAATAIDLFENDISNVACGDAGWSNATGRIVQIGIATAQYVATNTKANFTQALTPGDYIIGNEGVPDEDFCMIPSNTTAYLQLHDLSNTGALWNGVSGTVTVTSIQANAITGTFTAKLGDGNGSNADGGTLSGTFTAPLCP